MSETVSALSYGLQSSDTYQAYMLSGKYSKMPGVYAPW